ncbi:hypothetical protein Tco_0109323 [Tanacetum coccineum]
MNKALKASKDDFFIQHHPRGSGEGSVETPKVPDELNQKGSNKGSGVTLEVLDEPRDSLSGYSSEDEIEDISNDEEDKRDDDKEKVDESQKADEEILATDRIDDEKAEEEHSEKPEATKVSSSLILSSVEFTNQFLNDNPNVTVNEVLKDPVKPEVQSMVDIPIQQAKTAEQRPPLVDTTMTLIPDTTTISPTKPPQTQPKRSKIKRILKKSKKPNTQVDSGELESRVTRLEKTVTAISRFNLPDAIDKYVKAHLKNILPKDLPDFGKIKLKKAAKKSLPKECKAYNRHPTHKALYDALAVSLSVDEDDMDKQLADPPI